MIEDRVHQYLNRGKSWNQRPVGNIKKIVVHHSAIPLSRYSRDGDMMNAIQKIHSDKGWPGLSYHFVIGSTGKIYQTNNYSDITWHDSINFDSIGILVNGYFHSDINDKPTVDQLESLSWLLTHLSSEHPEFPAGYNDVYAHRDRKPTACPGDNLYPYVTEFREKQGKVSWGVPSSGDNMQELMELFGVKTLEELKTVWDREMGFLKDARAKVEELKKDLADQKEVTKAQTQALKETQEDNDVYIEALIEKLNPDPREYQGVEKPRIVLLEIDRLINTETEKNTKIKDLEAQVDKVRADKQVEIDELKKEIVQLQKTNKQQSTQIEKQATQIERLSDRLEAIEEGSSQPKKETGIIQILWEVILNLITKSKAKWKK